MSSSRTSALASAALASSRSAQTYPKAPGVSRSSFLQPQYTSRKGKERQKEEGLFEEEEDGFSNLSSRQKRLSRAARFGSSNSSSPISLPTTWNNIVGFMLEKADKKVLRLDYERRFRPEGGIRTISDPGRAAILHLTSFAPYRYASIYSVLQQVKKKLGPDEEGSEEANAKSWTPSRIVEYRCGSAEGLWAAVNVFGSSAKDGKGIATYVGYDSRSPHLKAGLEIYQNASEGAKETAKKGSEEKGAETSNTAGEKLGAQDMPLQGVHATFMSHPNSQKELSGSLPLLPVASTSDRDTLVICTHSLLTEISDTARLNFIKNIWESNPTAEAIVFIEAADQRGFAAIASARESLLGLDLEKRNELGSEGAFQVGRHIFYEVNEDKESLPKANTQDQQPDRVECHVVAPCPHDKSCPLLHDYEFLEPASVPTSRTSRASSPLFHGATLGMNTCSFPQRLHTTEYMRKTSLNSRADESSRYSYLVVRRGPRPSIARQARSNFIDEATFATQKKELRERAGKTKIGDIEEMRAGSKKDSVMLAEELIGENDASVPAMSADDMDEALARKELMKLLPDALKREMQTNEEGEGEEMEEAVRLAHEMMQKSANMVGNTDQGEDKANDEHVEKGQDEVLASAFLDQARLLSDSTEDVISEPLNASDFEAMRVESYQWPRLVQSAIKKSGHVTFDVCSCSGSIDRFTLSKSSGKQIYQDSRKSNWGDSFPHIPFSDEEGVPASVKSLVVRVPPASTVRGNLPATFKLTKKRHKNIEKEKRALLTSAQAISPDRVAEERVSQENYDKSMATTRRGHYEKDQAKERRSTRKRSLGYYDKAIQEAWQE